MQIGPPSVEAKPPIIADNNIKAIFYRWLWISLVFACGLSGNVTSHARSAAGGLAEKVGKVKRVIIPQATPRLHTD
jgi:hypothetical protein